MPEPTVDAKKCTGCKACVEACPMDVLVFDEAKKIPTVDKSKECIGCRACEAQCEHDAMKVKD
jgi:NAD-dependent dihydropyrimidine dehydrogenase PreA subunit